jgi:hypothetical protein
LMGVEDPLARGTLVISARPPRVEDVDSARRCRCLVERRQRLDWSRRRGWSVRVGAPADVLGRREARRLLLRCCSARSCGRRQWSRVHQRPRATALPAALRCAGLESKSRPPASASDSSGARSVCEPHGQVAELQRGARTNRAPQVRNWEFIDSSCRRRRSVLQVPDQRGSLPVAQAGQRL